MNTYNRHRFRLGAPPDIISYESIRLWCIKFGASFAKSLEQTHRSYGGYTPQGLTVDKRRRVCWRFIAVMLQWLGVRK